MGTQSTLSDLEAEAEESDTALLYRSETEDLYADEDLGWLWQPYTSYSHHMWLAFRVACGCVCVITPLLLDKGSSAMIDELRRRGIIMRTDVAMYLYTVYVTTGDTISLAWSAIMGTFLSVFNMWLMQGFFPGGWHEDSPPWWFWMMVINGAVFTFLMLYLDVGLNTRIFALSSYVFHIMAFLNPAVDESSSHSFQIDFKSPELREFKAATIGCMIAMLVTLVPCPIWAKNSASQTAERLVARLDVTWKECAKVMCSTEENVYMEDMVSKGVKFLSAELNNMEGLIDISYWETFCRQRAGNQRKMLTRLGSVLRSNFDDLLTVWENCKAETYGDLHNQFMALIKPHLWSLISEAGDLWKAATKAACRGHIGSHVEEDLNNRIARTKEAIAGLSMRFLEAKNLLRQEEITEDLIDEHSFCMNLCTYGRLSTEFAQAMIDHCNGDDPLPSEKACNFSNCFSTSKDRLMFAFRNWITIALGLFIGWKGYYERFRPFDAGIACTLAILLSKYSSSAMKVNLQRIQGVVIGTVFGQLVHALLGWCTWWGYALLLTTNFIWVWMTFFIYFHIPAWSTIALLISVFGTSNMIGAPLARVGCYEGLIQKESLFGSYYDIVNVCTALFLSAIVDSFMQKSAKVMAYENINGVWRQISEAIGDILGDARETRVRSGQIAGAIDLTRTLGGEAKEELSVFSSEWRTDDFDKAVETARKLRIFLDSIENTASGGQNGAPKDPDFLKATQLRSFRPIRQGLLQKLSEVQEYLEDFKPSNPFWSLCGGGDRAKPVASGRPPTDTRVERMELDDFIRETRQVKDWEGTSDKNLETDGPSQVCALLSGVQSMYREVILLQRTLRPMEEEVQNVE